jgi:hypothetical protein
MERHGCLCGEHVATCGWGRGSGHIDKKADGHMWRGAVEGGVGVVYVAT